MNLLKSIPGGEKWLLTQELASSGISVALRKHLRYAKLKGKYLVFVMEHPLALQEFKMQKEAIKEKMRIFYKEKINLFKAHNIVFADIHAVVIMRKESKQEQEKDYKYMEASNGEFINRAKDKGLHKIFEDIRQSIIKRKRNET
jgi:hypothetical protein